MYKVLSKILTNRSRKVIHMVISECQIAFINGRQILDGVLIVNEVVDLALKGKEDMVLFKVNFEKAYKSVSWKFLDYMIKRMGLGETWRKLIRECLSTARVSVLVNGSPIEEFDVGRRLRQGDPLSAFPFLIVA